MSIEAFVNAVEENLRRVEAVINQPNQLQIELEELDQLLRNEWPDAIIKSNSGELSTNQLGRIKLIFKKIKKLELKANSKIQLYDGIEEFMQRSRIS